MKQIAKLGHVVSISFAALVVFSLVGAMFKPGAVLPATTLVITVLFWAASRIVLEGIVASILLFKKDQAE